MYCTICPTTTQDNTKVQTIYTIMSNDIWLLQLLITKDQKIRGEQKQNWVLNGRDNNFISTL
jgi:hypothetical protein